MKNNFADNLCFLRTAKNLSQNDLANEVGLTRQTISNYEKGTRQPDLFALTKIANFFCISVDELIFSQSSINIDDLNNFNKIDFFLKNDFAIDTNSNDLIDLLKQKRLDIKNSIDNLHEHLNKIDNILEYLNNDNNNSNKLK